MSAEIIGDPENPLAIVVRRLERIEGIHFFSPESFPQQMGLMTRPSGYKIPAHVHNVVERRITQTQEVLFIRAGECLITIFKDDGSEYRAITLHAGDVILLAHGGHQIEMITECEILEVKQGPYLGLNDKTHFIVRDK